MPHPVIISIPHAGLEVPQEVRKINRLSINQIQDDSDSGASEIYRPLKSEVSALVTTEIARAFVDVNRAETDFSKDGVIKTHTSFNEEIYNEFPEKTLIKSLIEKYYRPYHANITRFSKDLLAGLDCHTMAEIGPLVSPDPGKIRPEICLGNADGTCPEIMIRSLSGYFEKYFETRVSRNIPFRGGYLSRSHSVELPWIQVEISRAKFLTVDEKRERLFEVVKSWCKKNF